MHRVQRFTYSHKQPPANISPLFHFISSSRYNISNKGIDSVRHYSFKQPVPLSSLKNVTDCYTSLPRRTVKLSGPDAFKLVQGLVTQDVFQLKKSDTNPNPPKILYGTMLSATGRILYDIFAHPGEKEDELLIECENSAHLVNYFHKYRLRSKVQTYDVTNEYSVWVAFGNNIKQVTNESMFTDPRIPALGKRLLLKGHDKPTFPSNFVEVSPAVYQLHRVLLGVPEGQIDVDNAFPAEHNLDYLNAINYEKGCYMGQEMTARTHYRGEIRKRVFPLIIASSSLDINWKPDSQQTSLFPEFIFKEAGGLFPSLGTLLMCDGKSAGKALGGAYHLGMGMIRLDQLVDGQPSKSMVKTDDGQTLRVLEPFWWDKYVQETREKEQQMAEEQKNAQQPPATEQSKT